MGELPGRRVLGKKYRHPTPPPAEATRDEKLDFLRVVAGPLIEELSRGKKGRDQVLGVLGLTSIFNAYHRRKNGSHYWGIGDRVFIPLIRPEHGDAPTALYQVLLVVEEYLEKTGRSFHRMLQEEEKDFLDPIFEHYQLAQKDFLEALGTIARYRRGDSIELLKAGRIPISGRGSKLRHFGREG